jgi:hypothetical protein
MSDELKQKILEVYLEHTEKSKTLGLWSHVVAEELGLDESEVKSECDFLEDDEYLEKESATFPGDKVLNVGVRITSKGN